MAAVFLLIGGAAVLVEWAGWQVAWRYGATLRMSDASWRNAFVEGVARNAAGAVGVGVTCALLAWWGGRVARRRIAGAPRVLFGAFSLGALIFLAVLAALTQVAP